MCKNKHENSTEWMNYEHPEQCPNDLIDSMKNNKIDFRK